MPTDTAQTITDLATQFGEASTERRYLRLLYRAHVDGYPVGALENAVEAEALSDWEAAACLSGERYLEEIEEARAAINAKPGPNAVIKHGHRAGRGTWALSPAFVEQS